jgi:hypothetical protein
MHIMKSLAARSSVIKSALAWYNKAAAELIPPAPTISWEQVADISILSEFHILHGSRRRILNQDWTKPENHHCVDQYHHLIRAQEEIECLNIEVWRLSMSIADKVCFLVATGIRISDAEPALGWAAQRLITHCLAVNALIMHELDLIKELPGYSGWHSNGIHAGTAKAGM